MSAPAVPATSELDIPEQQARDALAHLPDLLTVLGINLSILAEHAHLLEAERHFLAEELRQVTCGCVHANDAGPSLHAEHCPYRARMERAERLARAAATARRRA